MERRDFHPENITLFTWSFLGWTTHSNSIRRENIMWSKRLLHLALALYRNSSCREDMCKPFTFKRVFPKRNCFLYRGQVAVRRYFHWEKECSHSLQKLLLWWGFVQAQRTFYFIFSNNLHHCDKIMLITWSFSGWTTHPNTSTSFRKRLLVH